MGFRDDIESIKSHLPKSPERQTLLFSATVSPAIRQVAISTMSSSYKYINCVSEDDSPVHNHIPQYHTVVDPSQLLSYLLQLITHDQLITGGKSKIIVFFSTTKAVQLFSDLIVRAAPESLPSGRRTKVYEMHSKRDMARRMNISKCFRNDASGSCILVTSDVSARGVDYPGVSRVIQMGVPGSGDMYVHRVGRTGRGDNKTGRGDLVTCSWEMGFIKRQLRSMPLQTLTVSDMLEQIKELADSKDAEVAGSEYASRLDKIEPTCRTTLEGVGEEEASDTFISQVGFYFGRISEMGLNKDDVLSGLQTWAKELFRLERPPSISHSMQMRLGLLSTSSPSRSSYSSTSSYSSRSSYSSPSRSSGSSAPWMGRGNRPMASRQSGAGSGYNASSWGVGSGGYGSTSRDSKGSYAPRDSQFGSRDYKDNYTPRASQYGSRDSKSYTPGASQYGSRDSKSYTPGASKYGSRDSKSSKYGSRNSKDNYSSGGSKYGSRASAGRKSSDEYNWQD